MSATVFDWTLLDGMDQKLTVAGLPSFTAIYPISSSSWSANFCHHQSSNRFRYWSAGFCLFLFFLLPGFWLGNWRRNLLNWRWREGRRQIAQQFLENTRPLPDQQQTITNSVSVSEKSKDWLGRRSAEMTLTCVDWDGREGNGTGRKGKKWKSRHQNSRTKKKPSVWSRSAFGFDIAVILFIPS